MESKRRKISHGHGNQNNSDMDNDNLDGDGDHDIDLLPGLPDHISQVCLSLVNPSKLFSVCRSWRRLIYAPSFPPFLSLYALLADAATSLTQFHHFDPLSATWHPLPPPPLRLLLRHPSFVSRNLPIQSLSVAGKLLVLAATAENLVPALPRPLVFDPRAARWAQGPPLSAPRRWCAAGAVSGSAYVASGIGERFSHHVARSVERWGGGEAAGWERMSDLRDSRLSRDAIEAVGWRGRLCMVNVKGGGAKDGVVYDLARGAGEEIMPPGMIGGWRGPAAAMDEEEMFAVDEEAGALTRYVEERDAWEEVARSERLKGAEQMTAGGGKVCVVCAGGKGIVVVDVTAAETGRIWEVEPPPGKEVLAVHVLPRMIMPEQV